MSEWMRMLAITTEFWHWLELGSRTTVPLQFRAIREPVSQDDAAHRLSHGRSQILLGCLPPPPPLGHQPDPPPQRTPPPPSPNRPRLRPHEKIGSALQRLRPLRYVPNRNVRNPEQTRLFLDGAT